ncbi:DUF1456 domain-containing protein [Marivirga lumbricoides]|uniref:DUF1456 domain-containing protein n=1 Tax=Marivirga lumbricoides TaxID=1046115 RepID=A0ABQ1MSL2_9BACT|nr:DUF1456 domain-containing protein [Marivirga lumbricoides]
MSKMTNNDLLRRIRFIFDYSDAEMIAIFEAAEEKVARSLITDWLKRDEDPEFKTISDKQLATFLNGLINKYRGKKEGEQPQPENKLDNNLILKKLKIALNLKTEDIVSLFDLADMKVSTHEVSAFLRNPKQSQYRPFMDQFLRNFLIGLQIKYRNSSEDQQ